MDLNHLYCQHQLSLMEAAETSSSGEQARYLSKAGAFARTIRDHQLAAGAAAAAYWDHIWLPGKNAPGISMNSGSSIAA